ncbi:zinc finger protein 239-like [Fundulus heteroclitus]|uniref:zinc finger protein 239-like n=1 Tax=Fundulus heteroclitus TaxID=8078 RepID=UPI00165B9C4A|nr:zinc finger protein 239-like [Fundulus heteroclitus]
MSSVQHLREFIRERLTAAAEEIFSEVEKTIVRYEEDARLLESCWRPKIKTTRIEHLSQHFCNEDGVLTDQLPCFQQSSSSLDQREPEASHIQKDLQEQGHLHDQDNQERREYSWLNLDQEVTEPSQTKQCQVELRYPEIKEELDDTEAPLIEKDHERPDVVEIKEEQGEEEPPQIKEEQEEACSSQEVEQFILKQEHFQFPETLTQETDFTVGEPNIEHLYSLNFPVAQIQGHEASSFPASENPCDSAADKSVKCEVCGKVFKKKHHFNRHQRIHSGVRPYACTICGRGFTQSGHLKNHIRTHTGERPFSCETCGKSFSQVVSLNVHMRIHTGERPYSCEICGKSFTVITNLNFHRGTHADERPFPCETCGKGFSNYTSLKAHSRIHTREKLHFCETCGKSFTKNSALSVHMRTHTGERPYLCERCGKCFISKGDLKAHVRTHTGERPFTCGTCGKSFIQRGTLNVHMRSHAGESANAD